MGLRRELDRVQGALRVGIGDPLDELVHPLRDLLESSDLVEVEAMQRHLLPVEQHAQAWKERQQLVGTQTKERIPGRPGVLRFDRADHGVAASSYRMAQARVEAR